MSVEIERKFLVRSDAWKALAQGVAMRQGYLSTHPDRTVRVRIEGEIATLTIKGRTQGFSRGEWEYEIPLADAAALLNDICERPRIEKTRTRIVHEGMVWEVDEFFGDNLGLVVAEIELASETQTFARPDWLGEEVTGDARYFNSSLLKRPYTSW
ncbi:CYTH domain-containing protein [Oxalicibacterium solurbis]|uniref:CYTH domain-containing protein n=1 Tax=Oxalicibacterium solurbis TaxID=69280 RepID=A0A8J3B198_9BURK|nr:CYTH domain-containing protein [Oxalicibacterium solurbis]GGI52980.1 CYTH domain-containing protein [Oxalicibacterium solurbis]